MKVVADSHALVWQMTEFDRPFPVALGVLHDTDKVDGGAACRPSMIP